MQLKHFVCVKSNTAGKQPVQLVVLFALLFLLVGATTLNAQTLRICNKNGTESACNTGDIQKLTFSSGNMYLHRTNNQSEQYAIQDIRRLLFADISSQVLSYSKPEEEKLHVYPNPASDELTLEFEVSGKKAVHVQIFSIDGRLLSGQTYFSQHSGTVIKRINVNMLLPGVYICQLNDGIKTISKKFVKK